MAAPASSKQTLTTVTLWDYEYGPDGTALSHIDVEVELQYNQATLASPAVILENVKQKATTDSNGQWSVNIVQNSAISPANTVYTVKTPYRAFQVSVPSGAGPFQASSYIQSSSSIPANPTSIPGPLTLQNGPLTVQGDIAARSLTLSPSSPYTATAAAGEIAAVIRDNGGAVYNVKHPTYGAVGNGNADDTTAIQTAINAATIAVNGGIVFLPAGTYKTSAALTLKPNVYLLGAGMLAVKIQPNAQTFAAFTSPGTGLNRGVVSDLTVDYGAATGNVIASNAAAAAFSFTGGGLLGNFLFQNIYVQYAYYGMFDNSGTYLCTYDNFFVNNAVVGFYKSGGTASELRQVYVAGCTTRGIWLNSLVNHVITGCAIQSCTGNANLYMKLCHGCVINGLDVEANTVPSPAAGVNALMQFEVCDGLSVSGLSGAGNTLTTGAGAVAEIYCLTGTIAVFQGLRFGAVATTTATGTGTAYSLYTDASANQLTFQNCDINAPTIGAGPPTVVAVLVNSAASEQVVFINSKVAGTVTDAGGKTLYMGGATALTLGTAPSVPFQVYIPGTGQVYVDSTATLFFQQVARSLGNAFWDATGAAGTHTWRSNAGAATVLGVDANGNIQGYAAGVAKSRLTFGTGAPAGGNSGDYYFRLDGGGAGTTHLYFNNAGTWLGIA